jgi:hypothetical protein
LNILLGKKWKTMASSERLEFEAMAERDKIRYLKVCMIILSILVRIHDINKYSYYISILFTKEVTQYNAVSDRSIIPRINPPKGFNLDGLSSENKDAKPDKLAISRPLSGYSHYARQVCITIFIIFYFHFSTLNC